MASRRRQLAQRLLDVTDVRVWSLALLAGASAGQALMVAPAPFLVQRAFEAATHGGTETALLVAIAELVTLLLVSEVIAASLRMAALRVTKPATRLLRQRLGVAITHLPVDLVEPQSPYVHDVYVHDTERIDVMLSAVVGQILPSAFLVVGLSAALALAHPGFGLATLTAAIIVASAERTTRRRVRRRLDAAHRAFGEFSRGAWSMLAGFLVTRSHGAEPHEARLRVEEAQATGRASEAAARAAAFSNGLGRAIAALVFGVLLLAAGWLVQHGLMSIPAMLAITSTIALLRAPLYNLGQVAPQVQEGWRSWGRVSALLDAAAGALSGGVAPPANASIVLDGVGCRFGRVALFNDVSLTIGPGEVVALTGPNGAGKTTLVRQILGLTRPTAGAIRVGGVDFDELDLAAWRRTVGVVLQETWFFDGTIFDNLTYGAPSATRAAVLEACRLAQADDLVRELPAGLDTKIGAAGLRLSQGQRQRLAIARALVRRPRLLILDEPTNHLDEASARTIMRAIIARPDRPATLLITHQPEFAAEADRVLRLADGRLTSVNGKQAGDIAQTDSPLTRPVGADMIGGASR